MKNLKIMLNKLLLHRIEKQVSLFVSRQKFYFQGQFHTTKIINNFNIIKYLKIIIMLSFTKEGIVVQFLPEAEDFGVSLNQVL